MVRAPALAATSPSKLSIQTFLAVPMAVLVSLVLHWFVSKNEPAADTRSYFVFLGLVLVAAMSAGITQIFWLPLRHWMRDMCPIVTASVLLLGVWELITSGFRWLPMPYFPSPAGVLQSMINDRALLFDSTWHSLVLLLGGYVLGVCIALITGICIGWFARARYWGMPLLKMIGPIPATAWIPLAMVVSPSATLSAVGLIALAVWFPVTMLTASGISNTPLGQLTCGGLGKPLVWVRARPH